MFFRHLPKTLTGLSCTSRIDNIERTSKEPKNIERTNIERTKYSYLTSLEFKCRGKNFAYCFPIFVSHKIGDKGKRNGTTAQNAAAILNACQLSYEVKLKKLIWLNGASRYDRHNTSAHRKELLP